MDRVAASGLRQRLGETYRRVGVSACRRLQKRHQLRRDLLVIIAVSKSSLTFPDPDTPIRHEPTRFPSRRPILIETKYLLFQGQDTRSEPALFLKHYMI
jgi:hypothetical protein